MTSEEEEEEEEEEETLKRVSYRNCVCNNTHRICTPGRSMSKVERKGLWQ